MSDQIQHSDDNDTHELPTAQQNNINISPQYTATHSAFGEHENIDEDDDINMRNNQQCVDDAQTQRTGIISHQKITLTQWINIRHKIEYIETHGIHKFVTETPLTKAQGGAWALTRGRWYKPYDQIELESQQDAGKIYVHLDEMINDFNQRFVINNNNDIITLNSIPRDIWNNIAPFIGITAFFSNVIRLSVDIFTATPKPAPFQIMNREILRKCIAIINSKNNQSIQLLNEQLGNVKHLCLIKTANYATPNSEMYKEFITQMAKNNSMKKLTIQNLAQMFSTSPAFDTIEELQIMASKSTTIQYRPETHSFLNVTKLKIVCNYYNIIPFLMLLFAKTVLPNVSHISFKIHANNKTWNHSCLVDKLANGSLRSVTHTDADRNDRNSMNRIRGIVTDQVILLSNNNTLQKVNTNVQSLLNGLFPPVHLRFLAPSNNDILNIFLVNNFSNKNVIQFPVLSELIISTDVKIKQIHQNMKPKPLICPGLTKLIVNIVSYHKYSSLALLFGALRADKLETITINSDAMKSNLIDQLFNALNSFIKNTLCLQQIDIYLTDIELTGPIVNSNNFSAVAHYAQQQNIKFNTYISCAKKFALSTNFDELLKNVEMHESKYILCFSSKATTPQFATHFLDMQMISPKSVEL